MEGGNDMEKAPRLRLADRLADINLGKECPTYSGGRDAITTHFDFART